MTAADPSTTGQPLSRRSSGQHLGLWGVLLAAAIVLWEHLLNTLFHPEVSWSPAGVAAHMLLDLALLSPVVVVALGLGRLVLHRLQMEPRQGGGLLGAAGVFALCALFLVSPVVLVRDAAHESLGTRYGIALAEVQTTSVTSELTVRETTQLCSFRSVRNPALAGDGQAALGPRWRAARQALGALLTQQALLLPLILLGLCWLHRDRLAAIAVQRRWRRGRGQPSQGALWTRRAGWAALGFALLILVCVAPVDDGGSGVAYGQAGGGPFDACAQGGPLREYNVSAINVTMTLNRFGDHDPGAFMYVLDQNISAVRAQEAAPLPDRVSHGLGRDPIQPLVLRANLGECLRIHFTNQLSDDASLHILGLPHTAQNAGGEVGNNPDTFAGPGQTVTYQIPIPTDQTAERAYYFHDHGASRQRINRGLFGAIVAEPAGSEYIDPVTGAPLDSTVGSNWSAVIRVPGGISFREFVIMYHEIGDETFTEILDGEGKALPQVDEVAGVYRPAARALNYRSEPFRNRLALLEEPPFNQTTNKGKSHGYGSYMFGDPATPVPRSYLGEPTKTRLMHGGSEVFHVHHLHGGADRWRRNPKSDPANTFSGGLDKQPDPNVFSTHLDSQSIGPSTSYNLEHECGAGACQQVAGDFLYHCHIGHHYISGMWAFWRVFDTLQPDLAVVPELFDHPNVGAPPGAVAAYQLVGLNVDGLVIVDPGPAGPGEITLEDWIEAQLPPQGVRLDEDDATVWDWIFERDLGGNLRVKGEPEDSLVWANFASPTPGVRPEVLFNGGNGRYTWPLFRPHLGQRPPFTAAHTGAPWLGFKVANRPDTLCPVDASLDDPVPGRTTRFYPISAVTTSIPVTADLSDPEGLIFVLSENKPFLEQDDELKVPLSYRSNVQDCVEVLFVNEIPDGTGVNSFSKINMHSHFVQFDPQASDGVITGFSYEQSVRPLQSENRTLTSGVSAGATVIEVTQVDRLRPGIWLGVGLGEGVCTNFSPGPVETSDQPIHCAEIRRIAAIAGNQIALDQPLDFAHATGDAVGVEFVRYQYYSDVDSGTVFWHDHVDFKNWDHGLFGTHVIEPPGSTYHHPETGQEVRSGVVVDIRNTPVPGQPGVAHDVVGSFRELMLFLHNNSPVEGPFEDGGGTVNLRAEPFSRRGSAELRFSSVTFGDPHTPVVRAYVGDPVVIRGMGLVERVGGVRFTGHRFNQERFASTSDIADGTFLGISERFDLSLDGGAGGPGGFAGDYLYYSTLGRDFESGAWGLLRVHDTQQGDLQPLPDQPAPPGGPGFPQQTFTGGDPAVASDPGDPCPPGATLAQHALKIVRANVVYQDDPDIVDSGGIVYRLQSQSGGRGRPDVREPLVIRANEGDCVEISLLNRLRDPAGLTVGELPFDPQGSYGAAIGFNFDSKVERDEQRTFRFYADRELGLTLMLNLVDTDTIPRGAYGGVVVEPPGSSYLDPGTGSPIQSGVEATIATPFGSFREFVGLWSDEDPRMGQNTMPYPPEVDGFSGISYAAQLLEDRDADGDPSGVFSTPQWGDPRWVVEATQGEPVVVRMGQPWGEQIHVAAFEGHVYPLDPLTPGAELVFDDVMAPGMSKNFFLHNGAGGGLGSGDFLFLDRRQPFLEAGLWGILRVSPGGSATTVSTTSALSADRTFRDAVKILALTGSRDALRVAGNSGAATVAGYPSQVAVHAGTRTLDVCRGQLLGTAAVDPDIGTWSFHGSLPVTSPPTRFICVNFDTGDVAVTSIRELNR